MKIAITGTIGSGKTEVANYIRNKGYDVFDCDVCNSELLSKGNDGYIKIVNMYPSVLGLDNEIDKKKLADIIFNSSKDKQKIEDILHPLILKKMLENADGHNLFFAEVPLLFEKSWDKYFDISILVVSDPNISIKRLICKGYNKNDAILRIKNQMPVEDKQKRATEIIYNNGSLADLYKSVDALFNKYAW